MEGTMRGIYTNLTDIRYRVFEDIARLAYEYAGKEGGIAALAEKIDNLPYDILPGQNATYRESVFLERAVIGERIRLTMGLPMQEMDRPESLSEGIEQAVEGETYYLRPLIDVIKFACNACEDNVYRVAKTSCQGCMAHPCREICPKQAISFRDKKAFIDHSLCIACGRCAQVCPYHAIHHHIRPCAEACGMHCIGSDDHGRAEIDHERCTSCGMCLVNCPFGAIADKSQIFQVIQAINQGHEVIAAVAPAFVGQFGGKGNVGKLREAFKLLGFAGVEEVAIGADLCTIQEAEMFLEEVPAKIPFMGTSCCPAWSSMAKMEFPEHKDCISMALTPMVLTARLIRSQHPDAKIVFVGPCAAKKLEAMRDTYRSEVDFVLTFEEMAGMMAAKDIFYLDLEDDNKSDFSVASSDGRAFAISGGVANAVVNAIHAREPEREVHVACAEGLDECREMMKKAVKGQFDGFLLEGMACPGGCVAGAGTLQPINKSAAAVKAYAKRAPHQTAVDNEYRKLIHSLEYEGDGSHPDKAGE